MKSGKEAPRRQTRTAAETDHHRHGPPQRQTARRSVPTSEQDRTRRLIGLHHGFLLQTRPHPNTSEVGRFLRKRRVGRHGTPQTRNTADTDRSEIGPYLRAGSAHPDRSEIGPYLGAGSDWEAHRATCRIPATDSTSPMRFRGRAISPKAPRRQTRNTADADRSDQPSAPNSAFDTFTEQKLRVLTGILWGLSDH